MNHVRIWVHSCKSDLDRNLEGFAALDGNLDLEEEGFGSSTCLIGYSSDRLAVPCRLHQAVDALNHSRVIEKIFGLECTRIDNRNIRSVDSGNREGS